MKKVVERVVIETEVEIEIGTEGIEGGALGSIEIVVTVIEAVEIGEEAETGEKEAMKGIVEVEIWGIQGTKIETIIILAVVVVVEVEIEEQMGVEIEEQMGMRNVMRVDGVKEEQMITILVIKKIEIIKMQEKQGWSCGNLII